VLAGGGVFIRPSLWLVGDKIPGSGSGVCHTVSCVVRARNQANGQRLDEILRQYLNLTLLAAFLLGRLPLLRLGRGTGNCSTHPSTDKALT
jgi:hypothetical protein